MWKINAHIASENVNERKSGLWEGALFLPLPFKIKNGEATAQIIEKPGVL